MASKLPENLECYLALKILQVTFNFGNFICLSPFTIHYDGYLQEFKTKRSTTWRRCLTGFLHLASIGLRVLHMIFRDRIIFSAWNSALLSGTTTLIRMSIIYMVWCQDVQIVDLMTAVNVFYNRRLPNPHQGSPYKTKLASYGVIWILILWLLCDWMRIIQYRNQSIGNFLVNSAHFYFLRQSNYSDIHGTEDFTCTDYLRGSIYFLLTSAERCMYHFGVVVTVIITIAIWRVTRAYTDHLKKEMKPGSEINFLEVLTIMEEIHELIRKCSDCFGSVYCQLCISLIPLYATHLSIFSRLKILQKVSILYNVTGVLLVVLPAAITNLKIKSILPWMRSTSLEIERLESPNRGYGLGGSILIQEIQHDGFAFTGIFFRITYTFIGNVFSLMITYAMIILQLREK